MFVVRPHKISLLVGTLKVMLASLAIWIGFIAIDSQLSFVDINFGGIGFIAGLVVFLVGFYILNNAYNRRIGYITDRRIVKFEAPSLIATRSRSLSWEEAVKAKTFPPNFVWKSLRIGTVIVHAKTTIASTDVVKSENITTDNDVELNDVYYYLDLGNYIDKILYTYKKTPEEMKNIRTFVLKPKGQRG